MHTKKATQHVGMKRRSCRLTQIPHARYTRKPTTCLIDHPISQPSLDISRIWTPVITAEVKRLQLRPVQIEWENLCFCVGAIRRICLSTNDLFSRSSLVQGLIRVEFLILLRFCLSSRRWFVLCLACVSYLLLIQVSGDREQLHRLGPTEYVLPEVGDRSSLRNVVF
jgi:hypothetical protein